jgi:hypothetical protein
MFASILCFLSLQLAAQAEASGFKAVRITDQKGILTELVRNTAVRQVVTDIDYYVGMVLNETDLQIDGIRLRQGDGTLNVTWDKIVKIELSKPVPGDKPVPDGLEAQLWLTTEPEKPRAVVLVSQSKRGVHGWTDLGEFSIELWKIKAIHVVR